MSKIPATHQRKIVGHGKEAADWVRDQLGIPPELVNRVVITLNASDVVTADVRMFITAEMLASFKTDLGKQPSFTDGKATCLRCGEEINIDHIEAHVQAHAHHPRTDRPR
jgi:hypothetical protein